MVRGRIIIICVIVLVLGVGLRLWLDRGPSSRPAKVSRPATPPTEVRKAPPRSRQETPRPPPSRGEIALTREELEALSKGPWGRNPFLTPEEGAPLSPERRAKAPPGFAPIEVRAILVSEGKRIAMIDGHVVAEGDLIGEEEVLEIRPRAVVLRKGDHTRTVEMELPANIEVQSIPAPTAGGKGSEGGKTLP